MKSNFKRIIFSLFLLVSATAFSAVAAPLANDRITQLERIVMAQGQVVTQMQQRLFDTQRDIDNLRGQLETSQYQLNKALENQKGLYLQLYMLNKETTKSVAVAETITGSNEKQDYQNAISLALDKKQLDQAIIAFQKFLNDYPKSVRYTANTNYWLGQMYYTNGDKDKAAHYFAIVVKNHPNSAKVADSMYKVAMIMQSKNQLDKSKVIYQQIIKLFPNTTTAKKAEKQLVSM